jgi:hypothetical protein
MSFRIRPVYKEQTNTAKVDLLEQANEEESVESVQANDLATRLANIIAAQNGQTLTSQQLSVNSQMSLEQKKAAIMNQRNQVKPSARNSIRQTTFEGGFEGDMY